MKVSTSKSIAQFAHVAGVILLLVVLTRAAGQWSSDFLGFIGWNLLPYALLQGACRLAKGPRRMLVSMILSLLATAFAICLYVEALWFSTSSTSALVFIVVPFYQTIMALGWIVTLWVLRLRDKKAAV